MRMGVLDRLVSMPMRVLDRWDGLRMRMPMVPIVVTVAMVMRHASVPMGMPVLLTHEKNY